MNRIRPLVPRRPLTLVPAPIVIRAFRRERVAYAARGLAVAGIVLALAVAMGLSLR